MGRGGHKWAPGRDKPGVWLLWCSSVSVSMASCGLFGAAVGFVHAGILCYTPRRRIDSSPSASLATAL